MKKKASKQDRDKRIFILPRGWVVVGDYSEDGDWVILDNAAVVRKWGTSKGLGELADKGPLSSTVLDATPRQRFPKGAIINSIECNTANWKE